MDSANTSFVVHELPPLDPDGLMPLFAAAAHGGTRSHADENPWAMAQFADLAISPQWLDYPDPLRPPARKRRLPRGAAAALACAMLGAGLLLGAGHAAGLLPAGASAHPPASHASTLPASALALQEVAPQATFPLEDASSLWLATDAAESCQVAQLMATAVDAPPAPLVTERPQTMRSPGKVKHKHRPARPVPQRKRRS